MTVNSMEELGGECTSHPLLLTVYRFTSVPNTGGSAIVYISLSSEPPMSEGAPTDEVASVSKKMMRILMHMM
eukprot:SAG11_NODE_37333_length_257_cov_0.968354_1_plen_71_part_10